MYIRINKTTKEELLLLEIKTTNLKRLQELLLSESAEAVTMP